MAQLKPLDIPDDLYRQLQALASQQNRPVEAEVINLLQKGIQVESVRQTQAQLLVEIQQAAWRPPQPVPTSEMLLREIRGYDA